MPNTVVYKDFLFVTLPEHTGEFTLRSTVHCDYASISFYNKWNNTETVVLIPKGIWQIIGKGDQIDWEGIIAPAEITDPRGHQVTAKESGYSVIRSLEMEPGTTLVLKKNEK